MARASVLFTLLACFASAPAPAWAAGGRVAVIPPSSEDLDDATLDIVASTLADRLPEQGWTPVSAQEVTLALDATCPEGCDEVEQLVSVGEQVGADVVLVTRIAEDDGELVVRMSGVEVATGTAERAAAGTSLSGLLAKVVGLLGLVLPSPPEPPAEPEPETTEAGPGTTAPVAPGQPAGAEDEAGTTAPVAPGQPAGAEGEGEAEGEAAEPEPVLDQKGRIDVSISATMFAMLMTFTIMYAVDPTLEWYWYPPAMLLGGGVALATSLLVTWKLEVTRGDAAMFDACLSWGTGNGTLFPLAMGRLDARPILVGTVIGGGVGLAGGILVTALSDPSRGDAALASAAASWASSYAVMIAGIAQPTAFEPYIIAALVGMDVGLAGGLIASFFVEVDPRDVGIASLGGFLGSLLGASLGLPLLLEDGGPTTGDLRGYVGMILAFTTVGLTLGIVIPAVIEKKKRSKETKTSTLPYLVAHEPGGWKLGVPGLMPVTGPPGTGRTVTGAQVGLLGGVF